MTPTTLLLALPLVILAALPLISLVGSFLDWRAVPDLADRLERLSAVIDSLNEKVGTKTSWFTLFMVVIQAVVVVQRYIFGIGSIALQESIVYMHSMLFMLAAGYTLLQDGHVRVDIFYGKANPKQQAWINLIGSYVFLFPLLATLLFLSLPYVTLSWSVREGSTETSGIQAIFLLKTVIPIFCLLMFLQGVSLANRSTAIIMGIRSDERQASSSSSL